MVLYGRRKKGKNPHYRWRKCRAILNTLTSGDGGNARYDLARLHCKSVGTFLKGQSDEIGKASLWFSLDRNIVLDIVASYFYLNFQVVLYLEIQKAMSGEHLI
jgi:hypothetical protein